MFTDPAGAVRARQAQAWGFESLSSKVIYFSWTTDRGRVQLNVFFTFTFILVCGYGL